MGLSGVSNVLQNYMYLVVVCRAFHLEHLGSRTIGRNLVGGDAVTRTEKRGIGKGLCDQFYKPKDFVVNGFAGALSRVKHTNGWTGVRYS